MIEPNEIARLVAISRDQAVAGPPAMSTPIAIHDGYVYGLCPDDDASGSFVHVGVRAGWAPQPIEGGLLLAMWGGLKPEKGYEEEGVVAFLTIDGLRRLAADLAAIADSCDAMRGAAPRSPHTGLCATCSDEGLTSGEGDARPLSPCPWCRSEKISAETEYQGHRGVRGYVLCQACWSRGPLTGIVMADTADDLAIAHIRARRAASIAWNARSASPKATASDDRRTIGILSRALAWHGDPQRMATTREEWQQTIDDAITWVKAHPEPDRPSFSTWAAREATATASVRESIDRETIARTLFDQRQTPHDFDDAADADPENDAGTLYSIVCDDADAVIAALADSGTAAISPATPVGPGR